MPVRSRLFIAACLFSLILLSPGWAEDSVAGWCDAVEIRLEQDRDLFGFTVLGSCDLEEGDSISCQLFYLKPETRPAGEKQPRSATEEILVAEAVGDVSSGRLRIRLGYFSQKPYSGLYLARLLPLGKEDASVVTERTFIGTEQEFERQKEQAEKKVVEDLLRVQGFFHELVKSYEAFSTLQLRSGQEAAEFSVERWEKWRREWDARMKELLQRNERRLDVPIVWVEWGAKRRVRFLCEDLKGTADRYADALRKRASEQPSAASERPSDAQAASIKRQFEDNFSNCVENLGVRLPAAEEGIEEKIAALEDLFERARTSAHRLKGVSSRKASRKWKRIERELRRDLASSSFAAAPAWDPYEFALLLEISRSLERLIELYGKQYLPKGKTPKAVKIRDLEDALEKLLQEARTRDKPS